MKFVSRFYKSVLFLSLTLAPSAALALAPIINGDATGTDITINTVNTVSPNWTVLEDISVAIPAGQLYGCEVTCTSTVNNPYSLGGDADYFYAPSNSTVPSKEDCTRQFDFPLFDIVNDNDESDKLVVASTCFFRDLANNHIFRCLGARASNGDWPTVVDSTSMHVICVNAQGSKDAEGQGPEDTHDE
jgi:hypothetical protein